MMTPLLTMSTIDSIHELHFFFNLLLYQSNRNVTMTNIVPIKNNPTKLTPSPLSRAHYNRRQASRLQYQKQQQQQTQAETKQTKNSTKSPHRPHRTSFELSDRSNICSLEELFINIDRVIANDFLEQHQQSNTD